MSFLTQENDLLLAHRTTMEEEMKKLYMELQDRIRENALLTAGFRECTDPPDIAPLSLPKLLAPTKMSSVTTPLGSPLDAMVAALQAETADLVVSVGDERSAKVQLQTQITALQTEFQSCDLQWQRLMQHQEQVTSCKASFSYNRLHSLLISLR